MRVAGHRLTSLVRSRRALPVDRQRSACRPDELNGVGIEIDPRCGHRGKLDGSPTPEVRTTSSRGGGLSRALGSPTADLAAARRTFVGGVVGRFMTTKKSGNPLKTDPVGFPER